MLIQEVGRPGLGEYAASFERYVGLITEPDVVTAMARQVGELTSLLAGVSD